MLAWFAALLVLAAAREPWPLRHGARFLLFCCLIGVVHDWRYYRYTPSGYHDAAKLFDRAAAGTTVVFPEDPAPWQFELTKK
jgi:hypothetical protein